MTVRTSQDFLSIASRFAMDGRGLSVEPLGSGLINDTFRVRTDGPHDYVLQRINHAVFKDVALLQQNIAAVTRHIRSKLAGVSDLERKVLTFIPLKDEDKNFYEAGDGSFWRMSLFIDGARTPETVDPASSYRAGRAFGQFEAMLSDLPDTLGETIPDFHNMELRARQLHEAVAADAAGRLADPDIRALVDAIYSCEEEMCKAERMFREGTLPKRICHCDTKVNNMLLDENGEILCVIDLDTVMPSFVFSDFGDFMRTAGNTGAEDDPDPDRVGLDMAIFRAFAKGYIETAGVFLTPVERENLPFSVVLFPYMQTVRFLADYLNGDTYYKIRYPDHNRVRSFAQWKLFCSARTHLPEMKNYIETL